MYDHLESFGAGVVWHIDQGSLCSHGCQAYHGVLVDAFRSGIGVVASAYRQHSPQQARDARRVFMLPQKSTHNDTHRQPIQNPFLVVS